MNTTKSQVSCAALAVIATAACAGTTVPRGATVPAETSVSAASAVGAEQYPRARLHLKLARDQITTAERLIVEEEGEEAMLVLQRAEADARLAEAMARNEQLKSEAQRAEHKVRALRQTHTEAAQLEGDAQ